MGLLRLYPEQAEDGNCAMAYGNRIIANTLFHPLNYTKVLMQLGHEPMPLAMGRTMVYFGSERYVLPNAMGYMRHIYDRDGFFGLFNGWHASIGSLLCGMFAYKKAYEVIAPFFVLFLLFPLIFRYLDKRFPDKELKEEEAKTQFFDRTLVQLSKQTVAKAISLVAARPLRVVMLRTMAEFIGQEGIYNHGILQSVKTIYKESGFRGFFRGLMPELIAEICLMWITAHGSMFLVKLYNDLIAPKEVEEAEPEEIMEDDPLAARQLFRHTVSLLVPYVTSSFFYPFHLTSVLMAVNNCGLQCGQPPNCPVFEGWQDCFEYLKTTGQMKRGSKLFFRCYDGPVTYRNREFYVASALPIQELH